MSDEQRPDPEAFYLPVGDGEFEATQATESPWDERMQHGGPPAALLARAVEQSRPDPDLVIGRLTVDFLGAIPRGRMRVETSVVRPGKRVELVEARLYAGDRLAVSATAWRIRAEKGRTQDQARWTPPPPLPGPQPQRYFPGVSPTWGYGRAVEWRFIQGSYAELGPADLWARVRLPLVAGEVPSGVQRLAVFADSANGLSGELPMADWLFVPPTMTLTIMRPPEGDWIHLAAHSTIGPSGTGLAQGELSDADGLVAVVSQPLLVAPRS